MKLTSPAFRDGSAIPTQYSCDGDNVNPPLIIDKVPQEAQSLVLVLHDPDAPRGDFVHWTVWNIDPAITEIPTNSVPLGGVEGITDFGSTGYGGPCPPKQVHRYVFELSALDVRINLPTQATREQITQTTAKHVLATATLTGHYGRKAQLK